MSDLLTLTNRQIIKLRDGLMSLDGIAGRPNEVIRFEFDTQLSWNIAKNAGIINRAFDLYEAERNKISRDMRVQPGLPVNEANSDRVAAWSEKIETLKELQQEFRGLLKLKRAELQKGNKIPPGILANLMELLEE